MKKLFHVLPMFIIVGAAALCLSVDNRGNLRFAGNEDPVILHQTTLPAKYKAVIDECPGGGIYIDCLAGSSPCTPTTCSHTTASELF